MRCYIWALVTVLGAPTVAHSQNVPWTSTDLTQRPAVESFLAEYREAEQADSARIALVLLDRMAEIRSGARQPQFHVPISSFESRSWLAPDSVQPFVVGIVSERTEVEPGETVRWGGRLFAYSTAVSMGIVRNGVIQSVATTEFLGTPGRGGLPYRNSRPMLPFVPGSIIGLRVDGLEYDLLGYSVADSGGGILYFGMIEDVGLVHLLGVGSGTDPEGVPIDIKWGG